MKIMCDIMHLERKKGGILLGIGPRRRRRQDPLEELLDRAAQLPLEGQITLLMIARGMAYSRHCQPQQGQGEQPPQDSARERQPQEVLP